MAPAGSGSVTWSVNREMVVGAGWGRAILLQLAHPSIAAALHDHSSFRGGLGPAVRRLRATVGAMLSITFGGPEAMIAAAAGINTIHDRVRGAGYSAHDPELQRWVHATLVDSIPRTYECLVGPLTPAERDRYCVEAAIMEPLLGMPHGWLPRDRAQLDAYMDEMLGSGRLAVNDASRALAHAVLYPPRWRAAWPAFRPMQLLTIGSLPAPIRRAYGLAWSARDARALARWTAVLRVLVRCLPPAARHWPMARMMSKCSPDEKRLLRSHPPRRSRSWLTARGASRRRLPPPLTPAP
ncbi:MAG TPA: oxygenase MpaB family protein [Gammaproteobacteria bacterium]|nr:oxygenase MpaB family protein [Gammaproteobacteria bacterium]